eukprot:scaffold3297_cov132-Cylindrotheca_fusiformis.AAC.9
MEEKEKDLKPFFAVMCTGWNVQACTLSMMLLVRAVMTRRASCDCHISRGNSPPPKYGCETLVKGVVRHHPDLSVFIGQLNMIASTSLIISIVRECQPTLTQPVIADSLRQQTWCAGSQPTSEAFTHGGAAPNLARSEIEFKMG